MRSINNKYKIQQYSKYEWYISTCCVARSIFQGRTTIGEAVLVVGAILARLRPQRRLAGPWRGLRTSLLERDAGHNLRQNPLRISTTYMHVGFIVVSYTETLCPGSTNSSSITLSLSLGQPCYNVSVARSHLPCLETAVSGEGIGAGADCTYYLHSVSKLKQRETANLEKQKTVSFRPSSSPDARRHRCSCLRSAKNSR